MTTHPPVPGLHVSEADQVLTIRFDRPDVHNAFNAEMVVATTELLERASARDDVRAVVLTGTGAAFSTGADIGDTDARARLDIAALDAANRLVRAVVRCDKPVVAGVNGIAAGVGLSTALACDLVVARESASFLLAFARVGLMPDGGAAATVTAAIGRARAMRLAMLAEPMPAAEALRAGLVSHCVADDEYDDTLTGVVARLRRGAPLGLTATKRAVNAMALPGLEESLEYERNTQAMLLRTADFTEGVAAFTEKRRARFTGS